jgi:hypothetical protein
MWKRGWAYVHMFWLPQEKGKMIDIDEKFSLAFGRLLQVVF